MPRRAGKASSRRRPIRPADLARLRTVGDPQISPDGRSILFVRKHVGERNETVANIWIVDCEGASPARQFTSGGKDGFPRWSPDGRRVAFITVRDGATPQIWTMPADGGEATALSTLPEGVVAGFKWSPDGRWLAVGFREQDPEWTTAARKERESKGLSEPPRVLDDLWYRLDGDGYFNRQRFQLWLVDAESGEHRKLWTRDTVGHFSIDFAPDSRRLAISTNTDRKALQRPWKAEIRILDLKTGKTRLVPGLPPGPKERVSWSPDGKLLAYAGREGRDGAYSTENLELWVCDPVRGRPRSLTAETDWCLLAVTITDCGDSDFGARFRWTPDGKRLLAQIGWHGESHIAAIDVRKGGGSWLTSGALDHTIGNLSDDGRRVALLVSTPTRPADVHVGELSARELETRRLSDVNAELLSEVELARPRSHWVTSTDGARVQTWSLLPPRRGRRARSPAVLLVHGGPHAQYGVQLFLEFQILAAKGYAVFWSNPRGSKGYGRDHCAAIRGRWGEKDWDDVRAVTDFVCAQPHVDQSRVAIAGGSYGGYMTNWAISHSKAYACAITDRCVSNLVSMMGTSDIIEEPDRYWDGNAWDRPDTLWEQSPLRYFGEVSTPTLVIHSEGDLRCNVEQSEQIYTALQLRGVPSRFVRYPRSTSHGMSRSGPCDLRIHRLEQILEWLDRWIGARRRARRGAARHSKRS